MIVSDGVLRGCVMEEVISPRPTNPPDVVKGTQVVFLDEAELFDGVGAQPLRNTDVSVGVELFEVLNERPVRQGLSGCAYPSWCDGAGSE